jgi:hypothetical protein
MSTSADAADQVVNMSLQGVKVIAEITGAGAKNLATYLYAALKDQKRTRGKIRLEGLLRSGKELKVFAVNTEDLAKFSKEAKRYGILYCALRDKTDKDGMCDIMVRAEDAGKINRIVERFSLATVDAAAIKTEIEKSHTEKAVPMKDSPADNNVDALIDELMGSERTQQQDKPNPTTAAPVKSAPSGLSSQSRETLAEGNERHSIREELRTIKTEQKQKAAEPEPNRRTEEKPHGSTHGMPQSSMPKRSKNKPKKERS